MAAFRLPTATFVASGVQTGSSEPRRRASGDRTIRKEGGLEPASCRVRAFVGRRDRMSGQEWLTVVSVAAAGITMVGGAIGAAIGESRISAAAMDALARQPDEAGSITRALFVSLAMVESTAIFCLVVSLILLFANPYVTVAGG
jgi:F-type H+-transporting ATPase subunit c